MKAKIIYLIVLLATSATVMAVGINIGKGKNVSREEPIALQTAQENTTPKVELVENDTKKEVVIKQVGKERLVVKENLLNKDTQTAEPAKATNNAPSDEELKLALARTECFLIKKKISELSQEWDLLQSNQDRMLVENRSELSGGSPSMLSQVNNSVYRLFSGGFENVLNQNNYLKIKYSHCFQ